MPNAYTSFVCFFKRKGNETNSTCTQNKDLKRVEEQCKPVLTCGLSTVLIAIENDDDEGLVWAFILLLIIIAFITRKHLQSCLISCPGFLHAFNNTKTQ